MVFLTGGFLKRRTVLQVVRKAMLRLLNDGLMFVEQAVSVRGLSALLCAKMMNVLTTRFSKGRTRRLPLLATVL